MRKTAADAEAGVEGLLCKIQLLVDQLNMNDRAITGLKRKVLDQDVRHHERGDKIADQHKTLQRREKRAKGAGELRVEPRNVANRCL